MRIRGAIFDMDGTLLDSMPAWNDLDNRFLLARGIEPPADIHDALARLDMRRTADYLIGRFSLPDTPQQIMDWINRAIEEQYRSVVPAKAGAEAFLRRLRERGVPMCVATATDRPLAEAALRRTGLIGYFRFILTCTETGAGKDRPDIYHRAAQKLGCPPGETAVFEDALHAVATARAAGFRVVALRDDAARRDAESIRALADQYCQNFDECEVDLL